MILWCAYCQRFLGESAPFDDLRMSHGICPSCLMRVKSADSVEFQERALSLSHFFWELREAARTGHPGHAYKLIAQARERGIQPLDLAFGMIQPILNEIGKSWAEGSVSVATEHRFSAFAESLISLIRAEYLNLIEFHASEQPDVILANAEGNYHVLGLRFLELMLESEGVRCFSLLPGLPAREISYIARQFRPRIIGISAALPEHIGSVRELAEIQRSLPETERPLIYMGGNTIREGLQLRPEFGIHCARGYPDILTALKLA